MAAVIGRMKAALVVGAVTLSLVVSGTPALAKSIDCAFNTECTGTKKADTIQGHGQNALLGKNGNDTITDLGTNPDSEAGSLILGGSGNDRITSRRGSGLFNGGSGNDRIVALRGLNEIIGGPGDDVIEAKNGEPDTIDCGPGKDKVTFDAGLDEVTGCESQSS